MDVDKPLAGVLKELQSSSRAVANFKHLNLGAKQAKQVSEALVAASGASSGRVVVLDLSHHTTMQDTLGDSGVIDVVNVLSAANPIGLHITSLILSMTQIGDEALHGIWTAETCERRGSSCCPSRPPSPSYR